VGFKDFEFLSKLSADKFMEQCKQFQLTKQIEVLEKWYIEKVNTKYKLDKPVFDGRLEADLEAEANNMI